MLRHYVDANNTNWCDLLPQLKFAYNLSVQAATPFKLVLGYEPTTLLQLPQVLPRPRAGQRPKVEGRVPPCRWTVTTPIKVTCELIRSGVDALVDSADSAGCRRWVLNLGKALISEKSAWETG
ncbi:hypothetical protein VaNZ11_005187 [Volvox africanus]|uniref:Uncharacterized protein n=1 Tax=Volvox africanus TaxID=51714 RepID=A0ABQ5RYP8_9CHLO|nr:hypothetical protein VaNZ11_005187 [Volvox africanus]